jgi:hypothetical protein
MLHEPKWRFGCLSGVVRSFHRPAAFLFRYPSIRMPFTDFDSPSTSLVGKLVPDSAATGQSEQLSLALTHPFSQVQEHPVRFRAGQPAGFSHRCPPP